MAQIENVTGPALHFAQDPRRLVSNNLGIRGENEWVQIPLHCQILWEARCNLAEAQIPIYAQNLRARANQVIPVSVHAFRENDHWHFALQ